MAGGRRRERSAALNALAGVASGLVASWVMEAAQRRIMRLGGQETKRQETEAQGGLEPATVQAARRAASLARRDLPEARTAAAGEAVHYAVGAAFGLLFALGARRWRIPLLVGGALYGAGVWLLNDEALVPALGFSRRPWAYPASTHAKALAAHLIYGTATGAGLRLVQAAAR